MPDEPDRPDPLEEVPAPTEVVARPLPEAPEVRPSRAAVLRAALPQLARNPVVVGATAAAVTVVARLAVEVARRAVLDAVPGRPQTLEVTGSVTHEVHVVHHVVHHVVRHVVNQPGPAPVALWLPVVRRTIELADQPGEWRAP